MQINNLKQYIESLDSFLNYIQQADIINTEYIVQITSAIPEGLYFDNVSMTDEHLQIQGTAPNRQIIAEYLNNMKALIYLQKFIYPISLQSQPVMIQVVSIPS